MKFKKAISIVMMFSLVVSTTQMCSCGKNPTQRDIKAPSANTKGKRKNPTKRDIKAPPANTNDNTTTPTAPIENKPSDTTSKQPRYNNNTAKIVATGELVARVVGWVARVAWYMAEENSSWEKWANSVGELSTAVAEGATAVTESGWGRAAAILKTAMHVALAAAVIVNIKNLEWGAVAGLFSGWTLTAMAKTGWEQAGAILMSAGWAGSLMLEMVVESEGLEMTLEMIMAGVWSSGAVVTGLAKLENLIKLWKAT